MPFRLSLYRAPDGVGPMHEWEEEHRETLGTRAEVQTRIGQVFPQLHWDEGSDATFASWFPEANPSEGFEITLFGAPDEPINEVSMYSFPPPIRLLMSGLRLNHCYASESGELRFPFELGDRWA